MKKQITFTVTLLFLAAMAHGQTKPAATEDAFHFTSSQTDKSLTEAATLIRAVTGILQISTDPALATLTFQGLPDQVAMAHWILGQLNQQGNESMVLEYKGTAADDVVRVNFLANMKTQLQIQEILTTLRIVADVQRIYNYTSRQALVICAKSTEIALAEWIVEQLNLPADQKTDVSMRAFPGQTALGQVARVNYLPGLTQKEVVQLFTGLRTIGTIQKVFIVSSIPALILRGAESDIARSEWLIQELDRPVAQKNLGSQVYRSPIGDDVTQVFYLTNTTPDAMSEVVKTLRTEARTDQAFYMTGPAPALVVRGTSDQVEAAVRFMAQRNGWQSNSGCGIP